ncbi:M16 family metallopeptidase [Insolitispirillum peregrinum]|uniref:M16 family metallopeptidase n=1 Tax=Insolitispirillum peregrinum TaxID=80876 RepID=UPI00360B59A1
MTFFTQSPRFTLSPRTIRRAVGAAALVLTLGALSPAWAIDARKVVSPGGIEAWLVEDHSIPVLSLSVGFKGGSSLDPVGKEGLATMVAGLLDEGAADLDSQAFRSRLEQKAIDLSFSADKDSFSGSLRTTSDTRDEAFTLFRQAMTEPRFDDEPVERVRDQILTSLTFAQDDPQTIAGEAWDKAAFGDHPYSRPEQGTPASIKALSRDDLRSFTALQLVRSQMKIGVAGDITPAQLATLLDSTFGTLPATGPATVSVPDVAPKNAGLTVIERDIPQAVAVFGGPGLKREDPDFFAAYVANYILGSGGFSSRLMNEVREKRGLAYSVYNYLYPLDHSALSIGGVATNNARMKDSLDLIKAEMARMAKSGPTQKELDDARTYLVGAYPLRFTSTGAVASTLTALQMQGYPIEHLYKRNDYIKAVTLADAKRAAARLYNPDALTIVVVGKPAGLVSAPH